jgi:hypothetical protein
LGLLISVVASDYSQFDGEGDEDPLVDLLIEDG